MCPDGNFILVAPLHEVKIFNLFCIKTKALFLSAFIFNQSKYCIDYDNESNTLGDRARDT